MNGKSKVAIAKLSKVGRFLRKRRLRTDGSESHPYLKFANFATDSKFHTQIRQPNPIKKGVETNEQLFIQTGTNGL